MMAGVSLRTYATVPPRRSPPTISLPSHGVARDFEVEQSWCQRLQAGFYVGEWHFHPNAAPTPSDTDHRSMRGIATSTRYNCPEPVLVIVGGNPRREWTASAQVFPRGGGPVRLDLVSTASELPPAI